MESAMISGEALRNRIVDVLLKNESLDSFEDWLVQNSWNVHKSADHDLQKLVFAIELRLAEYSSDHLSENGLRKSLRILLDTLSVHIGVQASDVEVRSGSSARVSFQSAAFAFAQPMFAGRSLATASE